MRRYAGRAQPPTSHDQPWGVTTLGGRVRPEAGERQSSHRPSLGRVQMHESTGPGKSAHSQGSDEVARVGGAPHLESLPLRSLFLGPGCQIAL